VASRFHFGRTYRLSDHRTSVESAGAHCNERRPAGSHSTTSLGREPANQRLIKPYSIVSGPDAKKRTFGRQKICPSQLLANDVT